MQFLIKNRRVVQYTKSEWIVEGELDPTRLPVTSGYNTPKTSSTKSSTLNIIVVAKWLLANLPRGEMTVKRFLKVTKTYFKTRSNSALSLAAWTAKKCSLFLT